MISFGLMPTFIGCTSEPDSKNDFFHEMKWGFKSNNLYGVIDPPDFSKIYLNQHNEVVGSKWNRHHSQFYDFIGIETGIKYLEIGSGSGILLNKIAENSHFHSNDQVSWDVIDPNPDFNQNLFGNIYFGFFPEILENKQIKYDAIVHSHLIEHVYDPISFLVSCNKYLSDDGFMFMSWPNMEKMAENFDLNILMFEHLTFLPEKELLNLLLFTGFELIESYYFEDHSIFIKVRKVNLPIDKKFMSTVDSEYFLNFCNLFHSKLSEYVDFCNSKMEERLVETYIFGAHIFTQYLIAAGLDLTSVIGIIDNAIHKDGKRLYGTSLTVSLPSKLKTIKPINIILAAGQYEREIIEQLRNLIPSGSSIISKNFGEILL